MLRDLSVRNLAVVAEATLEFAPGLNVLTGETGAGKSIVVDALALLSGVRASSDLIRTGCDRLVVTGRFEPASRDWRRRLAAVGVSTDEDDVVVRREVSREGRNRVFLNDTPVTLKLLSDLAPEFVRIHTQREELGLLRPGLQREWLDQSGGVAAQKILAKVAALYREYRRLADRLDEVTGDDRLRTERVDLLRFQTAEIAEAQVTAGEEEALRSERDTLRNADAIRTALDAAYSSLFEGEGAVVEAVSHSERDLASLADWIPESRDWIAELAEARVRVEEVARTLGSRLATVDANPARLDEIESRLVVLERLCRKYGGSTVQVLEEAERILTELERLEVDTEQRGELEALVQSALDRYSQGAEKLSQAREQWGRSLADALHRELAELALKNTEFAARLGRARRMGSPLRPQGEGIEFGETGFDRVEFLFAPNPGEALAPLAKAASGGELARLYLALQLAVGAGLAPRPTVVFDEVDAGVGGAEAAAVGRKLKRLSETGQTIVVTHLPQVASFGDRHFKVAKGISGGRTETTVGALEDDDRVHEIARMLGGEDVTDLSLSHASELLSLSEAD